MLWIVFLGWLFPLQNLILNYFLLINFPVDNCSIEVHHLILMFWKHFYAYCLYVPNWNHITCHYDPYHVCFLQVEQEFYSFSRMKSSQQKYSKSTIRNQPFIKKSIYSLLLPKSSLLKNIHVLKWVDFWKTINEIMRFGHILYPLMSIHWGSEICTLCFEE